MSETFANQAANVPARKRASAWLTNMSTRNKLLSIVLILIAMAVAVGATGLLQLRTENQRAQTVYNDSLRPVASLASLIKHYQENRRMLTAYVTDNSGMSRQELEKGIAEQDQELDKDWRDYTSSDTSGREEQIRLFEDNYSRWRLNRDTNIFGAVRKGDMQNASQALQNGATMAADSLTSLENLLQIEEKFAADSLQEGKAGYNKSTLLTVSLLLAAVVVGLLLAWAAARVVAVPLTQAVQTLQAMAQGRLDQRLPDERTDEIGQIAKAVNTVGVQLSQAMREITTSAKELAVSSEQLSSTSAQLSSSADRSATQADSVAGLAEVVSSNVSTVAAGSEEMGASIREISSNANEAAQVASRAVTVADATNATVSKLGESSREIGNVIKVITSIAEQTNLLALNATIEAARAGEAGKGFAVVANEVKDLAQETAKATEDIARRVEAIQADTGGAVEAIGQISVIIGQINDFQTTIASAVEQQTATTNEMSRNVSEAADGSGQIATTIASMAGSAKETTAGANSTADAAHGLAAMATQLRQVVSQFQI